MTSFWTDKTPRSQGDAFNWRSNYMLQPTKFAADPAHRTPLYSKWMQTEMTEPWEKYRDERQDKAKLERRVHAMPKSSIKMQKASASRIPVTAPAKRGHK